MALNYESLIAFEPFKTLWKRDKIASGETRKAKAKKDIEFVYYMFDRSPNNVYRSLSLEHRRDEMIKDIYNEKFNEDDETLKWALEKWRVLCQTEEDRLLEAAINASVKIRRYFEEFDPTISSADPVEAMNTIDKITKANGTLQNLRKLRESADASHEVKKARGQDEVTDWENPEIQKLYVTKSEDSGLKE